MSTFVFLGPSLERDAARAILSATYLPPAAVGDVYDLVVREKPAVIAIIDGLFERVPSVWHKEILFALSRGIRVVGSSSMGALRAAELADFGMEGIGRIYEAYRSGALEDDDEVAVVHASAERSFAVMSEAMVNIRDGLRRALERGLISAETAARLTDAAKKIFYPERSWSSVFRLAGSLGVPSAEVSALQELVARERPNLKREDAVALLRHLGTGQLARTNSPCPFHLEQTTYWRRLVDSKRGGST